MISLKIKKYRPYADVTMVVNEDVEIHLGMLDEKALGSLGEELYRARMDLFDISVEFSQDE